jgi:hypothetical protein
MKPLFMQLSITSVVRSSNCSLPMDVEFMKLTSDSFCGNGFFKTNVQFCCHLCQSSSVIFRSSPSQYTMFYLFLSVFFTDFFSSLMLSSHDLCMPTYP